MGVGPSLRLVRLAGNEELDVAKREGHRPSIRHHAGHAPDHRPQECRHHALAAVKDVPDSRVMHVVLRTYQIEARVLEQQAEIYFQRARTNSSKARSATKPYRMGRIAEARFRG